jgi:hypothetical protein
MPRLALMIKEEDRELVRQLLEAASTPFKQAEEAEVIVAKCRALLESGAYADARELPGDEHSEHEQWTPLMHAANTGNSKLVHLLLEKVSQKVLQRFFVSL